MTDPDRTSFFSPFFFFLPDPATLTLLPALALSLLIEIEYAESVTKRFDTLGRVLIEVGGTRWYSQKVCD
jgi:hypothetical protein